MARSRLHRRRGSARLSLGERGFPFAPNLAKAKREKMH